jgi:hypothetical protein
MRQNKSAASFDLFIAAYQRDALACCGCRSQVIASQTLMSIKYEVIRRLGIRAGRASPSLSPEQGQPYALALAGSTHRGNPSQGFPALRNDDSFVRQCIEQRQALPPKIGYTEIPHT